MSEELMSLSALCAELSISEATGRNWIKLGKIVPSAYVKGLPCFETSYVAAIKKDLLSGANSSLKSRRNKKYISGNGMYCSYVPDDSPNLSVVQEILTSIGPKGYEPGAFLILALLAECALQLLSSRFLSRSKTGCLEALGKRADEGSDFSALPGLFLVTDLLEAADIKAVTAAETVLKYPELFSQKYTFVPGEDTLGLLYISLKSLGKRKAEGAYYTPTAVVKKLCDSLFAGADLSDKTILDPCCGTGNFILQLPGNARHENVYGGDTDPVSVALARINYCLKYGVTDPEVIYAHIRECDFLSYDAPSGYDYILGNPPWGSHFDEAQKAALRERFSSARGKNIESYDVFTEQALNSLSGSGRLSFVLPQAILNVRYHRAIRLVLIQKSSIEHVEFLGDVFDNVQCPSLILKTKRADNSFDTMGLTVSDPKGSYTISESRPVSAEAFDFFMTDEEYSIIRKMDELEGRVYLKDNADFALGIVTGDNRRFIKKKKFKGSEMILKGSDLRSYYYVPSDNYIAFDPYAFQQVADVRFYRTRPKLFYKFISDIPVFAYDDAATLSLNSCNILIPRIPGLDIRYVLAVLNSDAVRFYYKRRFNSVKILRSQLESIPIPCPDSQIQKQIVGMVDEILKYRDETHSKEIQVHINKEISDLYHLSLRDRELL
jgi:predicted RNA methylase